jgi:ABC-type methionine transport system permease subunit
MKTQSNSETPRTPWNYGWTRLHVGYYAAVFVVLSILLGVAHPIESLPFNLLIAALWPISTLVGFAGLVLGHPAAIAIPIACYAPYFMIKDAITSRQ